MIQNIKLNDFFYIPHVSTCIFTVKCLHNKLYVDCGYEEFDFLPSGKLDHDDVAPLVYLATPEIKAKLEEFYGITLEDIPVDEKLEEFKNVLNELSSFWAEMPDRAKYTSTNQLLSEATVIKDKLTQMFVERGKNGSN